MCGGWGRGWEKEERVEGVTSRGRGAFNLDNMMQELEVETGIVRAPPSRCRSIKADPESMQNLTTVKVNRSCGRSRENSNRRTEATEQKHLQGHMPTNQPERVSRPSERRSTMVNRQA